MATGYDLNEIKKSAIKKGIAETPLFIELYEIIENAITNNESVPDVLMKLDEDKDTKMIQMIDEFGLIKIPLVGKKGKGKFTLVCWSDYEICSKFKWHLTTDGYASTTMLNKQVLMQNFIMGMVKNQINTRDEKKQLLKSLKVSVINFRTNVELKIK